MAMAAVTACSSTPFARAICSKKTILQLSSRQGELAGVSRAVFWPPSVCISAAPRIAIRPIQPVASRRCPLTGKKANNGYKVSFSHHRTKHLQHVNLQYKRLWWEAGKRFVKLRISTKALKTIDRKGLDVMAKEAGIDLHKC